MDKKNEFLYTAIQDAQELIRLIDTKTAIVITILAAYIVALFSAIEKIIEYFPYYSFWFWFFLCIFIFFLILSIVITTRIIKPTNNPIDNINFGNQSKPSIKFFLTPNDYSKTKFYPFSNSSFFKLKDNFETYIKQLKDITEDDIISSLTLELFKVSFIRNIKNDRFNVLLWFLLATTIFFFITYLFFNIETQSAIKLIENIQ